MTAITELQRYAVGYRVQHLAGLVGLRVALDPDLYDVAEIVVTAQTYSGAVRAAVREMRARRNSRPRLVSITLIAERAGRAA